jgi:hypothetical protein
MLAPGARAKEPDEAKVTATMQCERATEPGRVKCSIEARAAGGRSIAWADVALLELPEFISALKGRIGPADATSHEPALQRWAFGLVAKKTGEGEAKARVRAVVCDVAGGDAAAPRCAPTTVDVRATVHVG